MYTWTWWWNIPLHIGVSENDRNEQRIKNQLNSDVCYAPAPTEKQNDNKLDKNINTIKSRYFPDLYETEKAINNNEYSDDFISMSFSFQRNTGERGGSRNVNQPPKVNSARIEKLQNENENEKKNNSGYSWQDYLIKTAQWIAHSQQDGEFCPVGEFFNDIKTCCLLFGSNICFKKQPLEKLTLGFLDDTNELKYSTLLLNKDIENGSASVSSEFYSLKAFLYILEETIIEYGYLKNMSIGIEILSLNDLKILFRDDINDCHMKINNDHSSRSNCTNIHINRNNNNNNNHDSKIEKYKKKRGKKNPSINGL